MKNFKYTIFSLVLILIFNVLPLKAEILFRGGFLGQNLSTSEGYNNFIKQRYGQNHPQIYGSILSASYKGEKSIWGVGLELDRIFGSLTYKTLNGENRINKIKLQNTIAFFALFLGKTNNFEIDLGYGTNKLTREFYGYQDYHITATNISNQEGVQSIKSDGTIKMFQIFYKFDRKPSWLPDKFFSKLSIDFGARYTESNHRISSSDPRPAYDSNGLPSETKFEVGGVGLLGTLTYHY
tara:strand:+ start:98 stop:811 length:714 start_codon:yes stop_codon:yes gene_type:complete